MAGIRYDGASANTSLTPNPSRFRFDPAIPTTPARNGGGWKLLAGEKEGQTQVDTPSWNEVAHWSHPVDVHFATKGIQGWPKFHVQVYHYDQFGRSEIYGYGFCHVPMSPGTHELNIVTWRPVGTWIDRLRQYFHGGGPQLRTQSLVYGATDRYRLQTETMGTVQLELSVIFRNFRKFGVET